jgi:hypothetical protein
MRVGEVTPRCAGTSPRIAAAPTSSPVAQPPLFSVRPTPCTDSRSSLQPRTFGRTPQNPLFSMLWFSLLASCASQKRGSAGRLTPARQRCWSIRPLAPAQGSSPLVLMLASCPPAVRSLVLSSLRRRKAARPKKVVFNALVSRLRRAAASSFTSCAGARPRLGVR